MEEEIREERFEDGSKYFSTYKIHWVDRDIRDFIIKKAKKEERKRIIRGLTALFNLYPNPHKNEIFYLIDSDKYKLKEGKE